MYKVTGLWEMEDCDSSCHHIGARNAYVYIPEPRACE